MRNNGTMVTTENGKEFDIELINFAIFRRGSEYFVLSSQGPEYEILTPNGSLYFTDFSEAIGYLQGSELRGVDA